METLWQDVRFAFRSLAKNPGVMAVSVLSLALGIGANTAIFTIVKAVFLQPVPFEDPHRVVVISTVDEQVPVPLPTSLLNLQDIRDRATAFSAMSIYFPLPLSVAAGSNSPRLFAGEAASGAYFRVLGVKPAYGRVYDESDDRTEGSAPLAVLSHGFWTSELGADPAVVGRNISINRQNFSVIGIMPFGFKGINSITEPAMWVPLSMVRGLMERPEAMKERRALYFHSIARLKPEVTLEQARASLAPIAAQLAAEHEINKGRTLRLRTAPEVLTTAPNRGILESATRILMTVVGLVLLISCANVAALLLVRARSRNREFAVRLAVGAGVWRIVRQMLTESLVLSISGGLLGLLFARWGRDLLWHFRPPWMGTNTGLDLSLDWTVLGFTLAVSVFTGLLFGLAPALSACRRNLAVELKERGVSGFREHRIFGVRAMMVMGQCALSVIALVGAGLFIESLNRLHQVDPGFDINHLLLLRLNPTGAGLNKEQSLSFYQRLLERMNSLGMVRSASVSSISPLSSSGFLRGTYPVGAQVPQRGAQVLTNAIAPRYFETAGIRLREGREFTAADRVGSTPVVIVNGAFERRFWPGQSAVGKTLLFTADTTPRTIVGVAADTKIFSLSEAPRACIYVPMWQEFQPEASLLLRSSGDPRNLAGAVREEVVRMESNLPLPAPAAMTDLVERSLWAQRLIAGMLAVFGLLALTLAAIGVYGLSSYAVSQRTSEIGIRMALGASPGDVLQSIVSNGMILVVPGVVLGLGAAFASSRVAANLLYGITATHIPAYLTAAVLLTAVGLVACLIPARRATKVDPVLALRHE
ncbi:MAG: ABC transporter permease [Acidobacteria bacterium]|nr:ABC transporter permease [Acidobacteriota bacterium]